MATKIGKYANSEAIVDSTLTQPKRKSDSNYISVEEQLTAALAAKKLKTIITNSAGGFLLLLLAAYTVVAGTSGFMSYNAGGFAFVTRPAFASDKIEGGYVKVENTKVYASTSAEPKTDFMSQVEAGILGAPRAVIAEIVNLDSFATVITKDGNLYILKDGKENLVEGTYSGEISGEYDLDDQYIAKCISGSCTKGNLFFLPRANIYGVV